MVRIMFLYHPLLSAISILIIATIVLLNAFLSNTLLPEQRALMLLLAVVGYVLSCFFFIKTVLFFRTLR